MSVQQITRDRLDQLLPRRRAIDKFIGTEVDWLSDPPGNIVGILAARTGGQNWGYAVLRRSQTGGYEFWDLKTRIAERDTARQRLEQVMAATQPNDSPHAPLVG